MQRKKRTIIIGLVIFAVLAAVLAGLGIGAIKFFTESDYFSIKEIVYTGGVVVADADKYIPLKGENLFRVNLDQVQDDIIRRYPGIGRVTLHRIFPDTVRIDIRVRKPFALVPYNGFYSVIDVEGVEVKRVVSPKDTALPVITGLRSHGSRPSVQLEVALRLLKIASGFKGLQQHAITAVEVSDVKNLSFVINRSFQVKIGQENMSDKLKILEMLLEKVHSEISTIKYIDLRFKEPAIAKK